MSSSRSKEKTIYVVSPEFKDCVFHEGYLKSSDTNRLLSENDKLIHHIKNNAQSSACQKTILMVGSEIQWHAADQTNIENYGTESCFTSLLNLRDHLKEIPPTISYEVDPYLLSDTHGHRTPGDNFDHAVKKDTQYNYSGWTFDKTKLSVLYAQTHKIASENSDARIIFDFCDGNDKRLDILGAFFSKNSDLLPKNVTLNLLHYNCSEPPSLRSAIQGTGEIDFNYHHNIRLMGNIVMPTQTLSMPEFIQTLQKNNSAGLTRFKHERQLQLTHQHNIPTSSNGHAAWNTAPKRVNALGPNDLHKLFSDSSRLKEAAGQPPSLSPPANGIK